MHLKTFAVEVGMPESAAIFKGVIPSYLEVDLIHQNVSDWSIFGFKQLRSREVSTPDPDG